MSDLTDEMWEKGFTPVNGERWSNWDRKKVQEMHEEIERLTAEVERRNKHCQDCPTFVEADALVSSLTAENEKLSEMLQEQINMAYQPDAYRINSITRAKLLLKAQSYKRGLRDNE